MKRIFVSHFGSKYTMMSLIPVNHVDTDKVNDKSTLYVPFHFRAYMQHEIGDTTTVPCIS